MTISRDDDLPETVGQRIRRIRSVVRPAEQRVLETLGIDYPISGLVSVTQLASKAGLDAGEKHHATIRGHAPAVERGGDFLALNRW